MYPDLSAEACRAELAPFRERINAAIHAGVRRFNAIQPAETLYVLSKRRRSRRTAIWACIMHELETALADVPGLTLARKYDTLELHVGANLVGRVKAMDAKGFTSNYQTPRVKEFHTERRGRGGRTYASEHQGELFTVLWAAPMRVDIGYVDDELQIGVAKIMTARRRTPKQIAWVFDMTDAPVVVPIPTTAPAAAASKDESRIVARQPDTKATDNKTDSDE